MRRVIIRDDDTNALTPVPSLERLYRPFLDRNLPVNLAVIPEVRTDIKLPDGRLEGFLGNGNGGDGPPDKLPITTNADLIAYLLSNRGYHVVQHGLSHAIIDARYEFDRDDRTDIRHRLQRGSDLLLQAGFPRPKTFVAPQDKLSPIAFEEVSKRYEALSSGWYEWRRIPPRLRPYYLLKKARGLEHWRIGKTHLLSHPGCLLSRYKSYDKIFESVKASVARRSLTVLVTHWWEYFPGGQPDLELISILHRVADWLRSDPGIQVISFDDFLNG